MPDQERDRLRELLDAVLDENNRTLEDMAGGAWSSPYHFSRRLTRGTGEPPVTMRRRVLLERAAWELGAGRSVTEAAWAAGYESVDGFARAFTRAFGHPPSTAAERGTSHWLPAPNGIHFHPPTSLWVDTHEAAATRPAAADVTELMLHHDVEDVGDLLALAQGVSEEEYRRVHVPGSAPLSWDGPDESLAQVLRHLVATKEIWLAAIEGHDVPDTEDDDPVALADRHREIVPRWLAVVRDIDRRAAWGDRIIDALCDPPESFVVSSVIAHVLTFSAHRRQLARLMLRLAGVVPDAGDPIEWLQRRTGGLR
ncbi:helix-turn-helix domain-containing protein [Kocuria sp. NPDC057446]|uniref:helix-turn-helix domain-containing protein n=1 Tax=Kocuria sp. NPDC057446 TaxID=3346137 RepID=UPI0036A1FE99